MCLIIDNDTVHRILPALKDSEYLPVYESLFRSHGLIAKLVYGGHLTTEYEGSADLRRILRVLDGAGRTRVIADHVVNEEEERIRAGGLCLANDTHVIALARVAGVRLLCTHDKALTEDFDNPALFNSPRGKVYKNATHAHLLARFCQSS